MSILLYSTNCKLKLVVQEKYFHDVHYVWCSESFDSESLPKYSHGRLVPPSSNPLDIYKQLRDDVKRGDLHSPKISAQRASFIKIAMQKETAGQITNDQAKEIAWYAENAPIDMFSPLVYLIPRHNVDSRLELVPADKRAGIGNEYILQDLRRCEFEVIEI